MDSYLKKTRPQREKPCLGSGEGWSGKGAPKRVLVCVGLKKLYRNPRGATRAEMAMAAAGNTLSKTILTYGLGEDCRVACSCGFTTAGLYDTVMFHISLRYARGPTAGLRKQKLIA